MAIAAVALRFQGEQLSEPSSVAERSSISICIYLDSSAARPHDSSARSLFTHCLRKISARTWELRGAAPPCSGTVFEVNASILYGSIPRATEADARLEEPPQRSSVTYLVVNLQLADEGLDGGVVPAVSAARLE